MKKKLFFLLVLLQAVGQNAFAYDFSYTYQGKTLFYTIQGNGVSVENPLSGNYYSYVTGDVVIPDSVENNGTKYAVISISGSAFSYCSGLTSVTIGGSITSIEWQAFYECSGLTSVTIPNSVTSISGYAFYNCSSLTSVTIPNSVTSIGNEAFYNCSGLTSVIIPNSVTAIGSNAFRYCNGLTSILVEAGNTHYDSRDNCNAIIQTDLNLLIKGCSSTVIPNTVTAIDNNAFEGCSGLTSVTIPNSVTSIGYEAFYNCSGLTSVTIPNSVTSIGYSAFNGCSGLTSLTIPNSVTSISNYAFSSCSGLTSVYCEATTPPTLGSYVFNYYSPIIYVPCGSVSAYQNATNWSDYAWLIQGMAYMDYSYSFVSNNETMGTVSVGDVDCDSNITVTATANSGYQFTGWSDGGTGNPRTFHLTGDTSLIAYFAIIQYTLTVQSNDSSMGSVWGSGNFELGTQATAIAIPANGYLFNQWSDGSVANPYTVSMLNDLTLIATFVEMEPVVQIDTVYVDVLIHDTTVITMTDTLYLSDTVYIHDTIYITEQGIGDVNTTNVMVYQRNGQIVVEGDFDGQVALYDVNGRVLAVKRNDLGTIKFDVAASGAYLIKVGNHPARKIVVVR